MLLSDPNKYFLSDPVFDSLFPAYVRQLSEVHWTPLKVAYTAAQFLAPTADARILDIGAGVGKFCMAAAHVSAAAFVGVEQRKNFARVGNKIIKQLGIHNASVIHGNFVDIDISEYTGVYFFNSFHENLVIEDSLDENVERSPELYDFYTSQLQAKLKEMPIGARLATYWLSNSEIPGCFQLYESHFNNLLKFWKKEY